VPFLDSARNSRADTDSLRCWFFERFPQAARALGEEGIGVRGGFGQWVLGEVGGEVAVAGGDLALGLGELGRNLEVFEEGAGFGLELVEENDGFAFLMGGQEGGAEEFDGALVEVAEGAGFDGGLFFLVAAEGVDERELGEDEANDAARRGVVDVDSETHGDAFAEIRAEDAGGFGFQAVDQGGGDAEHPGEDGLGDALAADDGEGVAELADGMTALGHGAHRYVYS